MRANITAILLVWMLFLLASTEARSADKADAIQPRAVPPLYVTENHGLVVHFPGGLTYCSLPADWVGSDHGTEVYLMPPSSCGASKGFPSTARFPDSEVPMITLFYGYNVVEDLDQPKAAATGCASPSTPIAYSLTLFGKPTVGCQNAHDKLIEISVAGFYSDENPTTDMPDHQISLSLITTKERLADDLRILQGISNGIHVCRPSWAKKIKGHKDCPQRVGWF